MPGDVGAAREQSFIERGSACLDHAAVARARMLIVPATHL
jgi:hypothetical protein